MSGKGNPFAALAMSERTRKRKKKKPTSRRSSGTFESFPSPDSSPDSFHTAEGSPSPTPSVENSAKQNLRQEPPSLPSRARGPKGRSLPSVKNSAKQNLRQLTGAKPITRAPPSSPKTPSPPSLPSRSGGPKGRALPGTGAKPVTRAPPTSPVTPSVENSAKQNLRQEPPSLPSRPSGPRRTKRATASRFKGVSAELISLRNRLAIEDDLVPGDAERLEKARASISEDVEKVKQNVRSFLSLEQKLYVSLNAALGTVFATDLVGNRYPAFDLSKTNVILVNTTGNCMVDFQYKWQWTPQGAAFYAPTNGAHPLLQTILQAVINQSCV